VRVLQVRDEMRLAVKSLGVDRCRELARQHLDRDMAVECGLNGSEDSALSTARDLSFDAVNIPERCLKPRLWRCLRLFSHSSSHRREWQWIAATSGHCAIVAHFRAMSR
jgi:hypothetical protein